jgi:hypothetical protein
MTANMVTAVSGFGAAPAGGYWGASPTPANLRGADPSMVAALLHLPALHVPPGQLFVAGVRDEAAQRGWAIYVDRGVTPTRLSVVAGDMRVDWNMRAPAGQDFLHVVMGFDAEALALLVNGMFVGSDDGGAYVVEPNRDFTVGNTDEDLTTAARDTGLSALAFGPLPPFATPDDYEALLFNQWDEVERALDILDLADQYTNVWSCRRGLPNVVDNGFETWVDWKAGVELSRVGVPVGMSVNARTAEWAKSTQAEL